MAPKYKLLSQDEFMSSQEVTGIRVVIQVALGDKDERIIDYFFGDAAGRKYIVTFSCSSVDGNKWDNVVDAAVRTIQFPTAASTAGH